MLYRHSAVRGSKQSVRNAVDCSTIGASFCVIDIQLLEVASSQWQWSRQLSYWGVPMNYRHTAVRGSEKSMRNAVDCSTIGASICVIYIQL